MVSIEQPDGGRTTYVYAANNQKDEFLYATETDAGSVKYLWDDQNVLQEYDVATEARYTYNPQPYGDLVSQRRENEPSYYHFDGNLSTSALTDGSGVETDRYRYTAFGTTDVSTGGTENPFTWKGAVGYYQAEGGLTYLRNRRYSPGQGRFVSADPLGLASGESNFYRYVGNDPVNGVDPSGLQCDNEPCSTLQADPEYWLPVVGANPYVGLNAEGLFCTFADAPPKQKLLDALNEQGRTVGLTCWEKVARLDLQISLLYHQFHEEQSRNPASDDDSFGSTFTNAAFRMAGQAVVESLRKKRNELAKECAEQDAKGCPSPLVPESTEPAECIAEVEPPHQVWWPTKSRAVSFNQKGDLCWWEYYNWNWSTHKYDTIAFSAIADRKDLERLDAEAENWVNNKLRLANYQKFNECKKAIVGLGVGVVEEVVYIILPGGIIVEGSQLLAQAQQNPEKYELAKQGVIFIGSGIVLWKLYKKLRGAKKAPVGRQPVHIDIGGEGRYPDAINVNPGMSGRSPVTMGPTQVGGAGAAGRPIPNLIQATGEQLPFANQSVDIITLQNAPIRPATVTEIARVIRPGGDIRLVGPNTPEVLAAHGQVADSVCGRVYQTVVGDSVFTNILVPSR